MDDKKSFILYADLMHTLEKLPDAECGQLFKHILRYVNDRNPETDNILVEIAFEPIRQQLKRDLVKWENMLDKRSDAGKKSAAKKQFDKWLKEHPQVMNISKDDHLFEASRCEKYRRESFEGTNTVDYHYYTYCIEFHQQMAAKSTRVESVENNSTKSTVSDNVSVSVNVNDNVINKPPNPLKGEIGSTKKNNEVETKKRAAKRTPAPKFEPDYSGMEPEVEQAFREFNEFRRTKRKAWGSQLEFERFVEKLRKLSNGSFNTAKEILSESIANGWTGIFELKTNKSNGKPQQTHEQRVEKSLYTANYTLEYLEREAARKAESERRRSESGN